MTKLVNSLLTSPLLSLNRKLQRLQACFCKRRNIIQYQYSQLNVPAMGPPETNNAPTRRRGAENGGSCKACIDFTKWLPVVFIVTVIAWSYYAFVIQLCIFTMKETWLKIFTLTVYHIVLFLFLWSYWKTVFTNSGRIPKKFRIPEAHMDRIESASTEPEVSETLESIVRAQQLPVVTRTHISQIRYCEKCSIIKPDRCHHCSVCGTCILKMDHHCPWVNNCVCFDNYKFFILFLGYAFLYCFVIFSFSLRYFIDFWSNDWEGPLGGRFHVLFVFFVAAMFAISLVSLFGYHCFLISKNQSTLESFRSPIFRDGPDKQGFSLGSYYNFIEVFGDDKKKWFLPIFSSMGDGITYPTRHSMSGPGGNYNSIDTTDTTTPGSGESPDYGQCVEVKVEARTENFTNELNANSAPNGRNNQCTTTSLQEKETPLVFF